MKNTSAIWFESFSRVQLSYQPDSGSYQKTGKDWDMSKIGTINTGTEIGLISKYHCSSIAGKDKTINASMIGKGDEIISFLRVNAIGDF